MDSWKKSALIFGLATTVGLAGCGGEPEAAPDGATEVERAVRPELPEGAQAVSFLGEPLYAPDRTLDVRREQEEQLAADLGAFAYLQKPVNIEHLAEVMRDAYRKVNQAKAAGSNGSTES